MGVRVCGEKKGRGKVEERREGDIEFEGGKWNVEGEGRLWRQAYQKRKVPVRQGSGWLGRDNVKEEGERKVEGGWKRGCRGGEREVVEVCLSGKRY